MSLCLSLTAKSYLRQIRLKNLKTHPFVCFEFTRHTCSLPTHCKRLSLLRKSFWDKNRRVIVNRNRHSKFLPAKMNAKWLSASLENAWRNINLLGVFIFSYLFFSCVLLTARSPESIFWHFNDMINSCTNIVGIVNAAGSSLCQSF